MLQHDDKVRLHHMLDAARKATEFSENMNQSDLEHDEKTTFAIIRMLEVVGEAARGVSSEFRSRHTQIPWKEISGTRDRLIHGYFDVDLNIVWQIVAVDLPLLITELEKICSAD